MLGGRPNLRRVPPFSVTFRNHPLVPCSDATNLGLVFDSALSWDSHVSLVTRRCFGILSGLSHLRGYLPPRVISALVNALVFTQIRYCISLYGNGSKRNLSRLQKIINYGAKVVFGRKKFDRASGLLRTLGWLGAEDLVPHPVPHTQGPLSRGA